MTPRVEVVRDPAAFASGRWDRLLALDPDRHVFATRRWHALWWEAFGAGKELLVLNVGNPDAEAIIPLYRTLEGGARVLRFVGGIDLTDYIGPICAAETRPAAARWLVDWLSTTPEPWDELDAHNLPVPLGFAESLVDVCDRAGFAFTLDQEETSAILVLPASWDEYLAGLGAKHRHELRRKRRRLFGSHPDAVVRTADAGSLEDDLQAFFDLHRAAQGEKGSFLQGEVARFFEDVARAFLIEGWLRLDLLEVRGRALAATFGFVFNGTYYLYNSAFDPAARQISPGLVLVSELVKRSIAEGLRVFDLLRGPERYKYQLGSEPVPLNNVRILKGVR